jgi:hypothetical protein
MMYWGSGILPLSRILKTKKHLRMQTDPVSETLCFLVVRILDNGQIPKTPVILSVVYHCQNTLDSIQHYIG